LWITLTGFFHRGNKQNIWGDLLNRFLTHKNQFAASRVKSSAFLPPKNLKLSVFLTAGLTIQQIWSLGEKHLAVTIYGRAELTITDVAAVGLKVDVNNKPERHANLIGWPTRKSEQKLWALKLADKSSLLLKSEMTKNQ